MKIPSLLWKPGVTSYNQTALDKILREKRREGSWQFSYRLLESLLRDFSAKDEDLLERILSSMEAGKGVYKITKRSRFERLDRRIIEEIRNWREDRQYTLHDAACSSGITSLELWRSLQQVGNWKLTASDYFTHLWLVDVGGWTVALDQLGEPMQITGAATVLSSNGPISPLLPVNHLMRLYVHWAIAPRAVELWRENQLENRLESAVRRLSLFHPLALEEAELSIGFELTQHNIFEPLETKVDVMRVMNFITPNHLTKEEVLAAFIAARQCLAPNGLLVVGRTRDESDGALLVTAYRNVGDGRLTKQWEMDGPWECESLAASLAAA